MSRQTEQLLHITYGNFQGRRACVKGAVCRSQGELATWHQGCSLPLPTCQQESAHTD